MSTEEVTAGTAAATMEPDRPQKAWRKLIAPLIVAVVGIGLILAGVALLSPNGAAGPDSATAAPLTGHALADFTLTDLAGKQVRLSDYAGRPVLINAWATWCPPCRAEMPDLQQLYQRHEAEGLAILAINAGEDTPLVKDFIKKNAFTFPVLLDPPAGLLDKWAIRDYPTSIVIGRDGKVKLVQVGILTADAINKVVEPLISE